MEISADIIAKAPKIQSIQIGDSSTTEYDLSTLVLHEVIVFGPYGDGK